MGARCLDILFVRNFAGFTGGHLKVLDYLRHTAASGLASPVLYLTPESRTRADNIFNGYSGRVIDHLRGFPAYFLAGEDWYILENGGIDVGSAPVVNLIQHPRHADRSGRLFHCLKRPALRICVSSAVAEAVRPYANGEVLVINNGVGVDLPPARRSLDQTARILVAGLKNPQVAGEVADRLRPFVEVDLVIENLPRQTFLERIAAATACVFLPFEREGFFLPALEAMAIGSGVVVPDCAGNRAYARNDENCLMPQYSAEALAAAALSLVLDLEKLQRLCALGKKTFAEHSLEKERSYYHAALARYLEPVR